jgi:putative ABC transport system substrate-binding protein
MRRREFIGILGATALRPLAALAQQPPKPVVGFLNVGRADTSAYLQNAFRTGLKEAGYIDGESVTVEYRWAEGHFDRLPSLAADFVHRQVTVIAATTTPGALAAKNTGTTIPIVFETAGDPIRLGLVKSLNHPGDNVTGVTQLSSELISKRLGLLHDLAPAAKLVGLLVDQADPRAEAQVADMNEARVALTCKSTSSMPAMKMRLIKHLRLYPRSERAACWWVLASFCATALNKSSDWRRSRACPRSTNIVSSRRSGA